MTTPKANVLRTLLQVVVAVCVAIPTAIALVPIPSKYDASVAFIIGLAGAIVILVTAVQNVIEGKAGVALFRPPTATVDTVAPSTQSDPNDATGLGPAQPRGPP